MQQVKTDAHSPGKWRVNGPLSNMPEFKAAWGCKDGDRDGAAGQAARADLVNAPQVPREPQLLNAETQRAQGDYERTHGNDLGRSRCGIPRSFPKSFQPFFSASLRLCVSASLR